MTSSVRKSLVVSPECDDVRVVRRMANVVDSSTADNALCLADCALETISCLSSSQTAGKQECGDRKQQRGRPSLIDSGSSHSHPSPRFKRPIPIALLVTTSSEWTQCA